MDSTITRTGIATAVKRRRAVAAATTTVAACVCAAAYIAGPAIAQDAEQDRSATPALKPNATVKVCKVAGPGIPIGTKSTFDIYNQPANHFSVPAGPAPGGYCVVVGHFFPTSKLLIKELAPLGTTLADVSIAPAAPLTVDLAARTATPTLHEGVNVLNFTNAKGPTGHLEICKRVLGKPDSPKPYRFDVNGMKIDVPAGTCSAPMLVAAGVRTITEAPRGKSKLMACSAEPAGALVGCNKAGRKAKVVVAPGDVSKETIATFSNARKVKPVYMNVCKIAGLHTAIGQYFPMLVTRPDGTTELVYVPAGPGPGGACVTVGPFALGERVNVSDLQSQYFLWTESLLGSATGPSPVYSKEINGQTPTSRPASEDMTIVPGPNRVIFRNDCPFPGSAPCLP
ncbi:MAG: hypothetical protein QOJ46_321 [bacterium]